MSDIYYSKNNGEPVMASYKAIRKKLEEKYRRPLTDEEFLDEIYREENLDVWNSLVLVNQINNAKKQASKSEKKFGQAAENELAKTSEQEQE